MPGKPSHAQVVYKPLAGQSTTHQTSLELDEEELQVIAGDPDRGHRGPQSRPIVTWRFFQRQHGRNPIGLRQFRTILLAVASILLIIFILKLINYSDQSYQAPTSAHLNVDTSTTAGQTSAATRPPHNVSRDRIFHHQPAGSTTEKMPQVLSSRLSHTDHLLVQDDHLRSGPDHNNRIYSRLSHNVAASKPGAFDDFSYSIGDQRFNETRGDTDDKWWSIQTRNHQRQVSVSNYIRAMKSFNDETSVTLVSQLVLKSQSFHHSLELCELWDGPISISVFLSRGLNELPVAVSLIKFVRLCLPAPLSACMQDKVTWHLVYTKPGADIESLKSSLSFPKLHLDRINYSSFADTDQCPKFASSDPSELIRRFQADILAKSNKSAVSLAPDGSAIEEVEAPVNVLRNVARAAASTRYVLVTDIDLYPSVHLAKKFGRFVESERGRGGEQQVAMERSIFALPAFEMHKPAGEKSMQQIPNTKSELVELVASRQAWPYQEAGCSWCQQYPRIREWLASTGNLSDKLTVYERAGWGRSGARGWSPFFLAQNVYPDYNELLELGERLDVMYEMCLLHYSVAVLDDGFLIKLKDTSDLLANGSATDDRVAARGGGQSIESALSSLSQKYKDSVNADRC